MNHGFHDSSTLSFFTDVSDFVGFSKSVTLNSYIHWQSVSFQVKDDSVLEDTEDLTISLFLNQEYNGVLLSRDSATVFIIDDEGEVSFAYSVHVASVYMIYLI